MIVQPTFYPCTREKLLFMLFLKVLLHTSKGVQLNVNMSVPAWTSFFYTISQNNTSSQITEMKREVLRSFSLQHLLKILMACLASCERIGLFVAEQLCSAKADVNF